jgi:hypothetical protein
MLTASTTAVSSASSVGDDSTLSLHLLVSLLLLLLMLVKRSSSCDHDSLQCISVWQFTLQCHGLVCEHVHKSS